MDITVECRTNLDDYKNEKWPTLFNCPPKIGNKVRSECGKELKIYGLTHDLQQKFEGPIRVLSPILIVELNK